MKLKDQVCSLDLSERLKELGVRQDSLFYWTYCEAWFITYRHPENESNPLSAFTVSELGEMLPQIIRIKGIRYQLFISVGMDKQFFVVYADEQDYNNNAPFPILMCHNEADARAKCLIWLIEQGYITG